MLISSFWSFIMIMYSVNIWWSWMIFYNFSVSLKLFKNKIFLKVSAWTNTKFIKGSSGYLLRGRSKTGPQIGKSKDPKVLLFRDSKTRLVKEVANCQVRAHGPSSFRISLKREIITMGN